jgi:hypothetical protein
MGFLDNLDDQKKKVEASKEILAERHKKAMEGLDGLLKEIRSCFGEDPKAHGIQINNMNCPVTGDGAPYQAPGLKIVFDPRRFIQVQPDGMAMGGYRVEIHFHGCLDNSSHVLLYAAQEEGEERVWAFFQKEPRGVKLTRWSKEAFEEILERQVIGKAPHVR